MEQELNDSSLASVTPCNHYGALRIAFCLLDEEWVRHALGAESGSAAAIQQRYFAAELAARGHRLTFAAPSPSSEVVYAPNGGDLAVSQRTWTRSKWFELISGNTWRIQRLLGVPFLNVFRNFNLCDGYLQCLRGHDVVHERTGLYNAGAAMAARKLKLPYVLFFDADQLYEQDYLGEPIRGLVRRRAESITQYGLDTAQAIVCVSQAARHNLVTRWRVQPEKVTIVRNGVDTERFKPRAEIRAATRAEYHIQSGELLIMFVGSFYKWHDTDTLLEGFARLRADHPQARLMMVGDGRRRPLAQAQSQALGIGDAVIFSGQVPHSEVPRLVNAADVTVALCPKMSLDLWLSPMKLFEYMAAGKAILATDEGQYAEVIDHAHNGLLVRAGDVEAVHAALDHLLIDGGLRQQLGYQARCDALTYHTWACSAARLEEVYRQAMARAQAACGTNGKTG